MGQLSICGPDSSGSFESPWLGMETQSPGYEARAKPAFVDVLFTRFGVSNSPPGATGAIHCSLLPRLRFSPGSWLASAEMASNSNAISTEPSETGNRRPMSEVLSETFSTFDHHAKVVTPFDNETKRDAEFVESGCML